ncbi:uncharacterized protein LOC141910197 [Tubulanus polymorphus]|uniref:uncharacterized protein LOC141910197 n=1 Tax=Tubulanus polymorphus TaxID=672921 RepID=UPI003DA49299
MQLSMMELRYYSALICAAAFLTFADGFSFRRQAAPHGGGIGNCCALGQTCRDASTCCDPDITEPKVKFNPFFRKLTLLCEECCPEGAVRTLSISGVVKEMNCPVLKCCNPERHVAAVRIDEQRQLFELGCVNPGDVKVVYPAGQVLVDGRIGFSVKMPGPITCEDSMPTYQSTGGYLVMRCA